MRIDLTVGPDLSAVLSCEAVSLTKALMSSVWIQRMVIDEPVRIPAWILDIGSMVASG